ncbi:MAG TPA: hypothetical protein VFU31_21100 [Candidatus Binatia bacterium]|nr:hypothetical protein [Candidatus Binatia bacterium]
MPYEILSEESQGYEVIEPEAPSLPGPSFSRGTPADIPLEEAEPSRTELRQRLQSELEETRADNLLARAFSSPESIIPPLLLPPEDPGSLENILRKLPLGAGEDKDLREDRVKGISSALRAIEGGIRSAGLPENLPLIPLAGGNLLRLAMGALFGGEALGAGAGQASVGFEQGEPETAGAGVGTGTLGLGLASPLARRGLELTPSRFDPAAIEEARFQMAKPVGPRAPERPVALIPERVEPVTTEVPRAERITEPTEVYGDLQPRPVEGAKEVPVEEGGAGVRPDIPQEPAAAGEGLLGALTERLKVETPEALRPVVDQIFTPEKIQAKIERTLKPFEDRPAEELRIIREPQKMIELVNPKTGESIPARFDGWNRLGEQIAEQVGDPAILVNESVPPVDFQITTTRDMESLVRPGQYIKGTGPGGTLQNGSTLALHGWEVRGLPEAPKVEAAPQAPVTEAQVALTPAERVELNELRIIREDRGRLGRLNSERLSELEAKEAVPVAESRISPQPEAGNIFDMDEGDLGDFFDEKFGEQPAAGVPGQIRRAGEFSFPNYTAFAKWMEERYAALDIEGMRNAFAEAPTEHKIKYIKANKDADPHKKAWITHLATGAELPKERPPVAQPKVTPGQPVPKPGQAPPKPPYPEPPPPPPRARTPYRKFDTMALVQLMREFGNLPKINDQLIHAYGRFLPKTELLELKDRLFWDRALAERVLGHEIGHFIDLAVQITGKGRKFGERLEPFDDLRARIGTNQELRNEARSLSGQWRGPFNKGDRYRDSAEELFADFMSAMFNNPEWVNQNFPKLHDIFTNLLGSKPSFRETYREIESWLAGDTMVAEWIGQQRESVKRTMDDLLKEKPRHREGFADWLKGATVSMWHRAFEKEGKPAKLGTSITDELEYSALWAAKENALFADDWTKTVQPELDKVNADPIQARTDLHAYSQARRTIGERRAAGVWIEQHPVEARAMLTAILDLSDNLRTKYGNQLASAGDAELYDLSAAIFREIHDGGERFVERISKEIDKLNLGVGGDAALQAFNVRGKLLNPGGLNEANAVKVIRDLRARLTPEQFRALTTASERMRDLLFRTQQAAHKEGLISDRVWNELIAPNRGNYVPYAVLDYWEGKVRAGVMPQKGTAKEIADVTVSSQLKAAALNVWRQRQRQVQLLRDAYQKGGLEIPIGERLRQASDIDKIRKQHPNDDISRAVLWQDGQPHLVEFPGDPGKTLEKAMDSGSFYEHMEWLTDASRLTHGMMQLYTTLSIPFLVYRNPIRGARTGALRVGFRSIGKQYLNPDDLAYATRLAKNYADAAFGASMLPEVRELVEKQMLLPPRLSSAMVRDAGNLREILENGGILASQLRQVTGQEWPWWKGGQFGQETYKFAEKVFAGYEAFEKIQSYLAAKARGASPEQAVAIGRRAGIPKPGVGGHFSGPMEVFFPWTRVHIQGVRSTLDFLRDPEYRKGFAARFMITEGMPRLLKVGIGLGIASGLVSWLLAPDEDEKDPVMAEVFRRVSPYKMALDDIIPLMLYDPRKGQYHYFNEFKKGSAIPQHYEVVSFRVPASEEGRLWGTLLYNTLVSIPGAKERLARPGEDLLSNTAKWAGNYLLPGISPAITTTRNLEKMILEGKNPEDPYRGQPSANKQLFDAGGVDRAQAIAGYTLNELGGPGEIAAVMAMNFGVLDPRAADALKKRLAMDKTPLPERVPLAKNMFSYDNYAQYRTEKMAELEENQLRARARLVMSDSVRGLYDYYWKNIERKKSLTPEELNKLSAAAYFVNHLWGNLNNPDSFYARAARSAGPDGSKQSRETVRRDLDQAAAPALARFSGRRP